MLEYIILQRYSSGDNVLSIIVKLIIVFLLVSYLPLITYSFYKDRHKYRDKEIHLLIEKVKLEHDFAALHSQDDQHLIISVIFASLISFFGLSTLFFACDIQAFREPNLLLGGIHVAKLLTLEALPQSIENKQSIFIYQQQALFVFGMAFLGAYLWGLQYFIRRFFMNDLISGAFFQFAIRMLFSAVIALLIFHSIDSLIETVPGEQAKTDSKLSSLLPVIAFFIGMFPQKGVKWLSSKLNFMSNSSHPSIRDLPLSMIEGLSEYHIYRLEEAGIDNCFNLANCDFITLLLKTPYDSREIIDWILQAKMCVRFGDKVIILREKGFRTVIDLIELDDTMIVELAKDSALIETHLRRIIADIKNDKSLTRLLEVGRAVETHCYVEL